MLPAKTLVFGGSLLAAKVLFRLTFAPWMRGCGRPLFRC